jgi:putative flippase GtrA
MSANYCPDSALRGMRKRGEKSESRQAVGALEVTPEGRRENSRKRGAFPAPLPFISKTHNDMQTFKARSNDAELNKTIAFNYLRGVGSGRSDEKSAPRSQSSLAPSRLVRWGKFNLVGGMGIVVQFVALFMLKSGLHFNYLFATVIAVEAAVVHNFVWHEQFTWADRIKSSRVQATSGAEAQNLFGRLVAALKRCATQKTLRASLRRFVRFNLRNGAVSILGNLALMKVMVGLGHMNYLLANAIAIALCSLGNFLVSEQWVFAATGE